MGSILAKMGFGVERLIAVTIKKSPGFVKRRLFAE